MNLQVPDKHSYDNKVKTLQSLLKSAIPDISRSVGSTLYEFVIRPMAIVYAAVEDSIKNTVLSNSISSLSVSSNTEPGDADKILSNFFISRKDGSDATSVLTVYTKNEFTRIPKGSAFNVNGTYLVTSESVCGVYPDTLGYTSTDSVSYVSAPKIGDYYCFNVQVHTNQASSTVLPAGMSAEPVDYIPGVEYAVLCSALEGGSSRETDASMVERAKSEICSWNGGSASINKILRASGIPVLSSTSFGPGDKEFNRYKGSELFIGTGGMIDTYVRTCVYPLSGSVIVSDSDMSEIHKLMPAGVLSIDRITGSSGNSYEYSVVWGSDDKSISPEGARLSVHQTISITTHLGDDSLFRVEYTYMPYIAELQMYVQRPDVKLVGVDIMIKAAIPTIVTIRGSLNNNGHDINTIKNSIKEFINNDHVGAVSINISHLNNYISSNYDGAYIVSPASIQANSIQYDGGYRTISSVSGMLANSDDESASRNMKFFCICDSGVLIE